MPNLYARNADMSALDRMLEVHVDELWLTPPLDEGEAETYYRGLKTTMLLSDWADELPDAKICERYSVGPGDVHGMVESVNWLLHATVELARMFATSIHPKVREYEICMKNGIRRELLPLVKLRGIGRVRARRLFNNNITSPDALRTAGIEIVTQILGQGIAEQIFSQLHGPAIPVQSTDGSNAVTGQSQLSRFG
jgi:helicase